MDPVAQLPPDGLFHGGWTHLWPQVYYRATRLGAYSVCASASDPACPAWRLPQTLNHSCDHCSYLGMDPCDCGATAPHCHEPNVSRPAPVTV